jgi:UDP-N-acetylglucosamine 2-epimerase (non-hydrolysing)
MHVLHVVGARPNFMKVAPVHAACGTGTPACVQTIVHTGQHYDASMSDIFFEQLGIPQPDVNLGVGSGTHSVQTAEVMKRLEPVIVERKPDWVLVYGDVNSTVAAALVCAKLRVRVAHVEAGLRSRDRTMPEEINRLVTDQLADLLFTPSDDGDANLVAEGIPRERIRLVGNVMIDTLVRLLPRANEGWRDRGRYLLVTLHRPSNVDDPRKLLPIVETLAEISGDLQILFPVHPRTREALASVKFTPPPSFVFLEPLAYIDFLALQAHAAGVITDSGGIQEETTFLGVPCLTMRENTERPVTVSVGTNMLIGNDLVRLRDEVRAIAEGRGKRGGIPPLWDGHAAERIVAVLTSR